MSTVKAYYDGITFFPIEALNIPAGRVVNLTIDENDTPNPEIARKLVQLACINGNLEKLNETEPLPLNLNTHLQTQMKYGTIYIKRDAMFEQENKFYEETKIISASNI